jgi:hypothetical protein
MDEAAVLVVLSVLAAGMASLTAVAVRWAAFTTTSFRASVVQFVLLMMAAMFTGILAYFAIGGTPGIVAGFWVAGALMSASVVFVALSFARERVGTADSTTAPVALLKRTRFVASVIVLVLTNEFLMGWSFSLLSGGLPVGLGPGGDRLGTILAGAVVSPWFVFPMALEMALTLRWLWGAVPSAMRRYLLIQPLAMVCSPPTIAGLAWAVGTAAGASALMAGAWAGVAGARVCVRGAPDRNIRSDGRRTVRLDRLRERGTVRGFPVAPDGLVPARVDPSFVLHGGIEPQRRRPGQQYTVGGIESRLGNIPRT